MLAALALLAAALTPDEQAAFVEQYRQRGVSEAGARQLLAGHTAKCALEARQLQQLRDEYSRFERARDGVPFVFVDYERARRAQDALNNRLAIERTEAELQRFRSLSNADQAGAVTVVGSTGRCPHHPPPAPPPPRP